MVIKTNIKTSIKNFCKAVENKGYPLNKVILFGSYVMGKKKYNDIDLALFSKKFGKDRVEELMMLNKIASQFDVSFDPMAVDRAGDSIFVQHILEMYSAVLRAEMTLPNGEYTSGYDLVARVYDNDIGTVTVDMTPGSTTITDNKQDFSDWKTTPESGNANYSIIAKDAKGNVIWGWLGESDASQEDEIINVFQDRNLTTSIRGWNGSTAYFDVDSVVSYEIKESYVSVATAFISSEPVPLKKGSEGSLRAANGTVDTNEAEDLLERGYSGLIDDQILDTENIYFTIVYDAGYPSDIKTAISTLCQTRRDCGSNIIVQSSLFAAGPRE